MTMVAMLKIQLRKGGKTFKHIVQGTALRLLRGLVYLCPLKDLNQYVELDLSSLLFCVALIFSM